MLDWPGSLQRPDPSGPANTGLVEDGIPTENGFVKARFQSTAEPQTHEEI